MHRKIIENWVGIVFVLAIVASFAVNRHDSHADVQRAVQSSVTRCVAAAPRAAYSIAFQYLAGDARRAAGNIITAKRYYALADAAIMTVAAPKGWEGRKELVEVRYSTLKNGKLAARLTPRALKLQKLGCEQAYS